jgi:Enoyl-CoA hydratase/isomerase
VLSSFAWPMRIALRARLPVSEVGTTARQRLHLLRGRQRLDDRACGLDEHLRERTEHPPVQGDDRHRRLNDCPKPTIACINGFCIGGGLLVAMLADIRFAAEGSQFGIPAAKLGVAYGYQGLEQLVALVGPSRARPLMYTGMRIDAAEALRIGLVDQIVAPTDLWVQTTALARTIAENAPLAVAAARITIAQILKDTDGRDMEAVKRIETQCSDSEDFREAAAIGVVLQENVLFNCSIRDNIALANPVLPLDAVVRAAELAGAHEFIVELANGYDTVLEERGSNLSASVSASPSRWLAIRAC